MITQILSLEHLKNTPFAVCVRGNWEIARRDLNNPRFISMVSTDRNFLGPTYDEYADSTSRSLMCCRSVAAIVNFLSFSHSKPQHINERLQFHKSLIF